MRGLKWYSKKCLSYFSALFLPNLCFYKVKDYCYQTPCVLKYILMYSKFFNFRFMHSQDMALLKDAKIKVINTDRYGRKVAKVYVGRYVKQY